MSIALRTSSDCAGIIDHTHHINHTHHIDHTHHIGHTHYSTVCKFEFLPIELMDLLET